MANLCISNVLTIDRREAHSQPLAYTHCSSYLYADDAAAAATDVAKYNIQSIFELNQRHQIY